MKVDIKNGIQKAAVFFDIHIKKSAYTYVEKIIREIINLPDKKERNRRLILLFATLCVADYMMYCFHTDKNIFDIFPSLPSINQEKKAELFLPALDGASIISETRSIPIFDTDEKTARYLFNMVAKGSLYDNTALAVPVDLFVRKVWIHGRSAGSTVCVFDLEPAVLKRNVKVIVNSEKVFKKALEKTITANIPSIKEIIILEKGISVPHIWEL